LICFRKALRPSATEIIAISELYQLSGSAISPTAYMILCVRFICFVRRNSTRSATNATLDTGGWLDLTRQGLSPCKMHQASLGALTYYSPDGVKRSGTPIRFQVEAPVTRRSPHRPGLEDFPHPVPRFRFFYQTINHSGDTPSGARLCCPFGIKYYGLSLARVADRSFEDPQRALYLFDSFGSTIFSKLSPCIRRQPPMPCNCL
jgi:hypothetical protein